MSTDARSLAVRPDAVVQLMIEGFIPETVDELRPTLDSLGGAINAGGWYTAAAVYAWTEPGTGQGERTDLGPLREMPQRFSLADFADMEMPDGSRGIRGLKDRATVARYRRGWERAIERGWAQPVAPGDVVRLPSQDFRETEAHVGANAGDSEWFTPRPYIEAAVRVMGGIDLDPASTAEANEVVGAANFYTVDQNGLALPWVGRVWMNPPYAQPACSHFCERLAELTSAGNVTSAVALVNNATETAYFQRMAEVASALCFPSGRVKFWHPDKESAPLQGQAVVYFGEAVEAFRQEFAELGFTASLR